MGSTPQDQGQSGGHGRGGRGVHTGLKRSQSDVRATVLACRKARSPRGKVGSTLAFFKKSPIPQPRYLAWRQPAPPEAFPPLEVLPHHLDLPGHAGHHDCPASESYPPPPGLSYLHGGMIKSILSLRKARQETCPGDGSPPNGEAAIPFKARPQALPTPRLHPPLPLP